MHNGGPRPLPPDPPNRAANFAAWVLVLVLVGGIVLPALIWFCRAMWKMALGG